MPVRRYPPSMSRRDLADSGRWQYAYRSEECNFGASSGSAAGGQCPVHRPVFTFVYRLVKPGPACGTLTAWSDSSTVASWSLTVTSPRFAAPPRTPSSTPPTARCSAAAWTARSGAVAGRRFFAGGARGVRCRGAVPRPTGEARAATAANGAPAVLQRGSRTDVPVSLPACGRFPSSTVGPQPSPQATVAGRWPRSRRRDRPGRLRGGRQ